jgi:hypothetical protein
MIMMNNKAFMLAELSSVVMQLQEVRRSLDREPVSPDAKEALSVAIGELSELLRNTMWPEPTVEQPDLETLEAWLFDEAMCEATDSCVVEPDGVCPHNHPSWLLRLGLI